MTNPEIKRLSVNIGPATQEALRHICKREGVTMTEAVRRLISYGNVVYNATIDGKDVLLHEDDKYERVVMIS